jgi:uncharacterized protein (UPF0128 family)
MPLILQGCRQPSAEEVLARYMHEVFGREAGGMHVIVMDVSGCGLCNEQFMASLAAGSLPRDSTLIVVTGKPKAVRVFLEQVKEYKVLADSGRLIYDYFRNVKEFRLPHHQLPIQF